MSIPSEHVAPLAESDLVLPLEAPQPSSSTLVFAHEAYPDADFVAPDLAPDANVVRPFDDVVGTEGDWVTDDALGSALDEPASEAGPAWAFHDDDPAGVFLSPTFAPLGAETDPAGGLDSPPVIETGLPVQMGECDHDGSDWADVYAAAQEAVQELARLGG